MDILQRVPLGVHHRPQHALLKRVQVFHKLSFPHPWAILLNNLTMPFVLLFIFIKDGGISWSLDLFHRTNVLTEQVHMLVLSFLFATMLSFTGMKLQGMIHASTFMAVTSFNKTFVIVAAVVLFNNTTTAIMWVGFAMNMVGCVAFGTFNESIRLIKSYFDLKETKQDEVTLSNIH